MCEKPSDDHTAIGLDDQGIDRVIRLCGKARVQGAVGVQARQVRSRRVGETASQQDHPVSLQTKRVHIRKRTTQCRTRIKTWVPRPARVQAGDVGPGRSIEAGEIAGDQDAAIGLHGDRIDRLIDAGPRIEALVQCAKLRAQR